jgi:hypothetical protein
MAPTAPRPTRPNSCRTVGDGESQRRARLIPGERRAPGRTHDHALAVHPRIDGPPPLVYTPTESADCVGVYRLTPGVDRPRSGRERLVLCATAGWPWIA